MIAIVTPGGAFVYGCSVEEAEDRINEGRRGGLDYDEYGRMRTGDDGLKSWLFMGRDLITRCIRLGCTAAFIRKAEGVYIRCDDMAVLDWTFRQAIHRQKKEATHSGQQPK